MLMEEWVRLANLTVTHQHVTGYSSLFTTSSLLLREQRGPGELAKNKQQVNFKLWEGSLNDKEANLL